MNWVKNYLALFIPCLHLAQHLFIYLFVGISEMDRENSSYKLIVATSASHGFWSFLFQYPFADILLIIWLLIYYVIFLSFFQRHRNAYLLCRVANAVLEMECFLYDVFTLTDFFSCDLMPFLPLFIYLL